MQPTLEERAALVLGLVEGTTRLDEIMVRHGVSRPTVAVWAQELVHAAPERFDAEMLAVLRAQGLVARDVHPQQSGRIKEVQPLELLQSLSIYKSAGHVLFFHPYGHSQVWFEGGQLIDARSGALEGTAAVYRIAGHEVGDFHVEVTGESRPRTIESSGTGLVLEAARRMDETREILERLPPSGAVLEAALPPGARESLSEDQRAVLALFDQGATVGEVGERSTLGELETVQVIASLQENEALRATGEQRRPEVPSVERRVHAIERALGEVSQRNSLSISTPSLRISASHDSLRLPSGAHPAMSPSPRRPAGPSPRMLAVGGAAAVLVIGLILAVAMGGDDDEPAPEIERPVAASEVVEPPPPPCPPSMVLLPEQELTVGHDDEAYRAAPVHMVRIPALCVDRHEVTAAEYRQCVETGACTSTIPEEPEGDTGQPAPKRPRKQGPDPRCTEGRPELAMHPINCISWAQADAFCRHRGKRLPTEAQWERAARAAEGRTHPWGHEPPNSDRLNACGRECTEGVPAYGEPDDHLATAPVGHYSQGATPDGVHDLAGNVREWTSDGFRRYDTGLAVDPKVPSETGDRVVRGGSFTTTDRIELHVAYRRRVPGDTATPDLGLRCVGTPAGPA